MVDLRRPDKASHPGRDRPTFDRIVGQDDLVEALTLVGVDDDLDGLLIRGEKGTAKSTAVRALAGALPERRTVADCPYGCRPSDRTLQCADCRDRSDPRTERRPAPLVTVPLGATREHVVGTLSVADAMAGEFEFDPGLLARAHRGLLYVDEVNLLDDHLVDVLLDAAASGVNRVERDGVSVVHPSSFTLVGTMNPEEGDLRPQLRDRFGLSVDVTACDDVEDRVAIVEGALDGWDDAGVSAGEGPESSDSSSDHAARIDRARAALDDVSVSRDSLRRAAVACRDAGVDGHRADVATVRAARALAAVDGRTAVRDEDVRRGAELALGHRLRSRPFDPDRDPEDVLDEVFDDEEDANDAEGEGGGANDGPDGDGASESDGRDEHESADSDGGVDESGPEDGGKRRDGDSVDGADTAGADSGSRTEDETTSDGDGGTGDEGGGRDNDDERPAHPIPPGGSRPTRDRADGDETDGGVAAATAVAPGAASSPDLPVPEGNPADDTGVGSGRADRPPEAGSDGPRVRTRRAESGDAVDAAASVRAAAVRGSDEVRRRDLRQSVAASDAETLVLFVVDASASMRPAMRAAKGTVLELLRDAYQERDEVGFVAFAGEDADVLLPPTDSVTRAARHLKELPTGDRTPLSAGLDAAATVLERADPAASVVVLVTDGRANGVRDSPVAATLSAARNLATLDPSVLVVDAAADERGVTDRIAAVTGGNCVSLDDLSAERVDAAAGATDPSR